MFTHRIDDDTYLKLLDVEDAQEMFALTDASRDYLREWLPWVDHTKSMADSRVFIEGTKKQFAAGNGFQVGIFYQNELAGVAGFHAVDWNHQNAEIGYWLGEGFQGYGLMTKTCRALIDHAFRKWELNRVQIRCAVGNTRSCAIPERLGFTKEGCIRKVEKLKGGHFASHNVYGILKSEWLEGEQRYQ